MHDFTSEGCWNPTPCTLIPEPWTLKPETRNRPWSFPQALGPPSRPRGQRCSALDTPDLPPCPSSEKQSWFKLLSELAFLNCRAGLRSDGHENNPPLGNGHALLSAWYPNPPSVSRLWSERAVSETHKQEKMEEEEEEEDQGEKQEDEEDDAADEKEEEEEEDDKRW